MKKIAVLGGGPAGLSCAIALSACGHEVMIFERHSSLEPVGAGILMQPSGLHALQRLGMRDEFEVCSVPVNRLVGIGHQGWLLVDVPYNGEVARGVSRPALTELLEKGARSHGAQMRLGSEVKALTQDAFGVTLTLTNGQEFRLDAAVIASGSGSTLAGACGIETRVTPYAWGALNAMVQVPHWEQFDQLQQRYQGPRKMFGLLPTATAGSSKVLSLFWSMPVHQFSTWQNRDLQEWKQELLALWPQCEPVLAQIHTHEQLSFARYRHAWPQRLANGRICLVGDAAHAMSPQLGLGTTLAMGDALSLASCLSSGSIEEGFAAYERERLGHVRKFQLLSRALTPCFQADLPAWWRDALFAGSLRVPGSRWLMRQSLNA